MTRTEEREKAPKYLTNKDLIWKLYGKIESLNKQMDVITKILVLALAGELGLKAFETMALLR